MSEHKSDKQLTGRLKRNNIGFSDVEVLFTWYMMFSLVSLESFVVSTILTGFG